MPEKPLTNVELVVEMMEYSRYGAVVQLLIVEAIRKYAETVSQADPATFDSPFINGEVWVAVAGEVRQKMQANYGWD
ncbi:hypothetical protein [Paracidovorax valerianellae]|uniref:Uncharacterized protein n=1 Tax=Paracidovorax valerianellae TaxID=187868 RepID=A0A1G7F875_9BURK|nr:hypothetical protein [Paracidovorax valerianellae]MDA8443636.1 hypothetical protein [Paracidovorax valerianellae]SDE72059.1 hypothetical protein SAMN05192589_12725 [Paracidovorax valerianellae]